MASDKDIAKNKLKELLAKNQLEEAFDLIESIINNPSYPHSLQEELILLKRRYSESQKERSRGIVTSESYSVQRNLILSRTLDLIERIPEEIKSQGIEQSTTYLDSIKVRRNLLIWLLLLITSLMVAILPEILAPSIGDFLKERLGSSYKFILYAILTLTALITIISFTRIFPIFFENIRDYFINLTNNSFPPPTNTKNNPISSNKKVKKLNEAKLILLGDGEVGKTTIRENLINENYKITSHLSTLGIDVVFWVLNPKSNQNLGKIKLNIWDFGGQGKYRPIQQFFCTRKALYLYVSEPERISTMLDDYSGIDYWMGYVSAFGYDKEEDHKSPVIYILNKIDLEDTVSLKEGKWKSKFDNIKDFVKVSCKTGVGVSELKLKIEKHLLDTRMIGLEFNANWVKVKEILEKKKAKFITRKAFFELWRKNKMSKNDAEVWLNYLIAVGVVLHFPETTPILHDHIILDPNWVREIAYRGLDSSLVNKGRFGINEAIKIWEDIADPQMALDLLKSFDLCFEVKEEGIVQYVIPGLFPRFNQKNVKNLPTFDKSKQLKYTVTFSPFIPAGLFHRIVVRHNDLIVNKNWCWRNCVIFSKFNSFIKIVEDWEQHKIHIFITGKEIEVTDILVLFRNEIGKLCIKLQKEKYLENITMSESIIFKDSVMNLNTNLWLEGEDSQLETLDEKSPINRIGNRIQQSLMEEGDKANINIKQMVFIQKQDGGSVSFSEG